MRKRRSVSGAIWCIDCEDLSGSGERGASGKLRCSAIKCERTSMRRNFDGRASVPTVEEVLCKYELCFLLYEEMNKNALIETSNQST